MGKAGRRVYRALGLMSGTSLDGIDVALLETDGESLVERGPSRCYPYEAAFRQGLRGGLEAARAIVERSDRPGPLASLEQELTELHVAAVHAFLAAEKLAAGDIDVIGFHGQTVLHRPDRKLTVQIGDGARLARETGIDVVYDLREADCAAGGQGAPLAPIYHAALSGRLSADPAVFVNIGGVANVTLVRNGLPIAAFDCGPGNALIDDWVQAKTGESCDAGGALAAAGKVDEERLSRYLADPFFAALGPKSLDRNHFSTAIVQDLSTADGAATLTQLTASAIARSRWLIGVEPRLWVITGGGRWNRWLMAAIAGLVDSPVIPAEAVGLDGDALEAEAWAYLAVRSLRGFAISFPGTTGASLPLSGGRLACHSSHPRT